MKNLSLLFLLVSQLALGGINGGGGGNTLGLSCSDGQVPEWTGSGFTLCLSPSGSGTVTSVNTNSTTSGIFVNTANVIGTAVATVALQTQVKNKALLGPTTGSDAAPTFRLLVGADLPNPGASSLGGVNSKASVANQFLTSIGTDGTVTSAQPTVANVTGAAPLASPTFTGTVTTPVTASRVLVSGASSELAASTVTAAALALLAPSEFDSGNTSTAKTLDWTNGTAQKSTLTGNVTYTLTNPVTGTAYVIRIATGAGSFTATWPASVKWSGGTAPTITTAASKVDLINLYWDGTNYYGSFSQNY